jgi:8-amino-7-oxononanoate synthase
VASLKRALPGIGLKPSDTPIQPLVLGANAAALHAAASLRERGIIVPAIRPPTVPEGTARLRISLSAAHDEQDVSRLAAMLREACASGAEAHV